MCSNQPETRAQHAVIGPIFLPPQCGQIEELRRSLKQVRQDNEQHVEELDKLRHEKSVLVNTTHAAKRAKTDLEVGLRLHAVAEPDVQVVLTTCPFCFVGRGGSPQRRAGDIA